MFATTNPMTGSRRAGRAVGAGLLALAAFAALPAAAQGAPGGPDGHPMGPPGPPPMMGEGMMMMGSPAQVARMADRMLDGLGVTEAQRTQIRQLAQAAAADLKTLRDDGRGLHEKSLQLLAAPSIDTAALESLRQQMLAQHDRASQRTLKLAIDVANVLTPEQRAKLGERMKQRAEIMRDRMQRMQHEGRAASGPRN